MKLIRFLTSFWPFQCQPHHQQSHPQTGLYLAKVFLNLLIFFDAENKLERLSVASFFLESLLFERKVYYIVLHAVRLLAIL
jgi:hypothetical protein